MPELSSTKRKTPVRPYHTPVATARRVNCRFMTAALPQLYALIK